MELEIILWFSTLFLGVICPYPPSGDEVVPGSVLLPASRRGRYLANIVRRQAVDLFLKLFTKREPPSKTTIDKQSKLDGTGIKFNKDADRMNAEAKKKVDVLSDELLPYIIAEQERRTTLYKRIMTAIQNGEKGVTIAEIRNKPPLIIKKGLMYRCPANRAPKEPDGSGVIKCEENIDPTQVMYDSCLSAEDKDLYVADNKYFFCNRHRVEGPDLPRNGSAVISCAPMERTSLNYTTTKCALEDTDDVVVHYRYYPDRSYKFVTELDPDHEMCDHWNPCQIGYIFSLPSIDTAIPANELWQIVPQDAMEEYVHPTVNNYRSSVRRVAVPHGYKFSKVYAKRNIDNTGWIPDYVENGVTTNTDLQGQYETIEINFPEQFSDLFYASYYAIFTKSDKRRRSGEPRTKSVKFLNILPATAVVQPQMATLMYGQEFNDTLIPYKCNKCILQGIMIRTPYGLVTNFNGSKYHIVEQPVRRQFLELKMDSLGPQEFGDFFVIVQNADGIEERVMLLSLRKDVIKLKTTKEYKTSSHIEKTIEYECDDCQLLDILCNAKGILSEGKIVAHLEGAKRINFNMPKIPTFSDKGGACAYLGIFNTSKGMYRKLLTIVEKVDFEKASTNDPPIVGEEFDVEIPYKCSEEPCVLDHVRVNGIRLENAALVSDPVSYATFKAENGKIHLHFKHFSDMYYGFYLAIFKVGNDATGTEPRFIIEVLIEISRVSVAVVIKTNPDAPDIATTSDSEDATVPDAEDSDVHITAAPDIATTSDSADATVPDAVNGETSAAPNNESGETIAGNTTTLKDDTGNDDDKPESCPAEDNDNECLIKSIKAFLKTAAAELSTPLPGPIPISVSVEEPTFTDVTITGLDALELKDDITVGTESPDPSVTFTTSTAAAQKMTAVGTAEVAKSARRTGSFKVPYKLEAEISCISKFTKKVTGSEYKLEEQTTPPTTDCTATGATLTIDENDTEYTALQQDAKWDAAVKPYFDTTATDTEELKAVAKALAEAAFKVIDANIATQKITTTT